MIALFLSKNVSANTFTVTTTNDSGTGSLRQAITDANNHAGLDTIDFNIAGAGVQTITPSTSLPTITDAVIIDGYSQPGASANTLAVGDNAQLRIQLDGSTTGQAGLALGPGASGSTIRGLIMNNYNPAIFLSAGFQQGSSNNIVEGNFIGVNPAGTAATATNTAVGMESSTNNTIGGTTPAARNVLCGTNAVVEINISDNNTVQGNYICLNAAGTAGLNCLNGVLIESHSANNVIGGSAAGAGNVIGQHQQFGIWLPDDGGGNVVQGNFIGTDATGTIGMGSGSHGLFVQVTPNSNTLIGGTNPGEGNVIAFNGQSGVTLHPQNGLASGVRIEGNSIFSNATLGIDLNADGVTLNDAGDADTGCNNSQNFPVITQVTTSSGMTTIKGTLNSTANTQFRIELFANDAIDTNDFGEGKTFLGFVNTTTNASGDASFMKVVTKVAGEPHITATATDPNGNTSEFSAGYGQLLNISTREKVLTNNDVLIGGFIVSGDVNKEVLLRALGPTLTQLGVAGALSDTTLELYNGGGTLLLSNDNWGDAPNKQAIIDTNLAPPNSLESAILTSLAPGNYTAILRGKGSSTGVGLVEVYDRNTTVSTTLTNISSRGFVDVDQNVMIGGLISGNGETKVIIRALGPTLTAFNVPNVLADPVLDVRDAQGTSIATNDDWKSTQQAEIQASGFAPPNDKEPAVVISRPSGNTTAIVTGKNRTTGNALVEVYQVP